MKKGKFEAGRKPKPEAPKPEAKAPAAAARSTEPAAPEKTGKPLPAAPAPNQKKQQDSSEERRRPDWLLIVVPLAVLAALGVIVFFALRGMGSQLPTEPEGMTKVEVTERFTRMAEVLEHQDMTLTLQPEPAGPGDVPIVLVISPAQSRVRVDLKGLEKDLEDGVGRVSRKRYVMDSHQYVSFDRSVLRTLADETEEKYAQRFMESIAMLTSHVEGDRIAHDLLINVGKRECAISADEIYDALLNAYYAGNMSPELRYSARIPVTLDPETIYNQFCTAPTNARLDEKTFEIIPEIPGYGFEKFELEKLLTRAEAGRGYVLAMGDLTPDVSAADVEASLYCDVLAEAHTPHVWNDDRTTNLILACEAIDGTILMPGEVFSFNDVVGERTKAKGYREAIAYVGGASVPEIGGGVCQVASSIYYAVLQADLHTVQRHAHQYLVTYVPQGMDAAIYWGSYDYKFENSSPTPLKIQATVADGDVHIYLLGREWKDYSVKLSYKILKEIPYETKEQVVYNGSAKPGDVLVTPYTGYEIETYRTVIDKDGNEGETNKISYNHYSKRDKVIAVAPPEPKPTEPKPTENDEDEEP